MTAQLAPSPVFRSWDNLGFPLVGGKLNTYEAGTTTRQATYTDSTQGTPNTNPVILNFRGEAFVWLDPSLTYKFVLTDAFNNLIWSEDNIPGGFGALPISSNLIPNPSNTYTLGNSTHSWANVYLGPNDAPVLDSVTGNIGYYARTASEIAAGSLPTNYSYPPGHVFRFGADPTGSVDSTAAIQAALNVQVGSGAPYTIIIPVGTYLVSNVVVKWANTIILGSTASQNSVGASTVLKGTSATNSVLTVNTFVTGALIKGVYFDRSVTATGGAGIFVNDEVTMDIENCKAVNQFYGFLLGATNFGRIYNSQAEQCYSHGFAITQNTVTISPLQWIIDTCISQANNGGGFVIIAQQDNGSGQGTVGPRCNASGTFANAQIGWQFTGAVPINDVTCIDCYSSFDGQGGWDFEKVGTSIELIGCFAEGAGLQSTGRGLATGASHVGVGLLIESGGEATAFVNLVGFISRQNSFQGIGVASNAILKSLNLTNCQFYDNGQYGHTYGIDIEHTTVIVTLTGCTSRNDNTSNQTYGLHAATPANIWATACDFSGNATGGTDNLTSMNAIACNGVPEQLIAFQGTTSYANDAAAAAGGVLIGGLYRNGSVMQIRIA